MRKQTVKVVIWGFGAMGSGMAKMLTKKQGLEIVGVCDRYDRLVGKKVSELLGTENNITPNLVIKKNIAEIIPLFALMWPCFVPIRLPKSLSEN